MWPQKHTIIINLARREDRWEHMKEQLTLSGLAQQAERIEAVDGSQLDMKTLDRKVAVKNNQEAVVGCYLSHAEALQRALEVNKWPTLVLEDDMELITFQGIPGDIPRNAGMVSLSSSTINGKAPYKAEADVNGWLRLNPSSSSTGALLYMNQDAARRALTLLQEQKRYTHVDTVLCNKLALDVPVYVATPPVLHWITSYSDILGKVRTAKAQQYKN